MVFDTTASNTGAFQGSGILFVKMLGRNLVWFECRHHMSELVVKPVWIELFGPDKSSKWTDFGLFKKMFPYIKKDVVITLTIQSGLEQELRNCTVDVLRDILENPNKKGQLPRDDYKELAELTLVLLGENVLNFSFKQPGAHHKARFMANVIYGAKMFALKHLVMDWKLMEQDDIAMEIEFDSLQKQS